MIFKRKTFLFSSSSRVCSYLVRDPRKGKRGRGGRERGGGRKIRKEGREKKTEESEKGNKMRERGKE